MPTPTKLLAPLLAALMSLGGFFAQLPMRIPLLSTHLAVLACREGETKLYPKLEATVFLSVGNFMGDSTVTFNRVYAPRDGIYTLNIHCFSGDDRSYMLSVNGSAPKQVRVEGTGSWSKKTVQSTVISLQKGMNTLKFSCFRNYAPDLDRITITPGPVEDQPPSITLPAQNESFPLGGLILVLDKANGVYSVKDGAKDVFINACAAVLLEGNRVYSQDYNEHTIEILGTEITFTHREEGKPTLRQVFRAGEGAILTHVELLDEATGGDISTNWIAPLLANGEGCLRGGDTFIRVPFDNDDYATFSAVNVNTVDGSFEATALVDTQSGAAVVLGSVTHDTWKTGISWSGYGGSVQSFSIYSGCADPGTRDTQPHGTVSGSIVSSSTIYIATADDWRDGLDAYGEANAAVAPILPWDKPVPIGYNSWGTLQARVNRDAMYAISDYVKGNFHETWKAEGSEVYINFDSFWDNADAINSREKAEAFVAYVNANGQKAGIYYTPFACWLRADQLEGRTLNDQHGNLYPLEECLLRDEEGNLLRPWVTALAYDVTHPAVQWRVYWDIKYFLDCGFEYLKLDFITHAAMEGTRYDKTVQTGLQAYNQAMAAIADQVGGRMFINLAMSPIFPHQYAHSRRVACDTWYSLSDTKYMLSSLRYGFWEQKLYALPDPDLSVVWGKDGRAGENEARSRVTGCVIAGTTFLAGDDFPNPAGDAAVAQARFEKLLCNPDILSVVRIGKIFRPAHFTEGDVYVMEHGGTVYVAVFNLDANAPASVPLDLAALTGIQAAQHNFKELWSGKAESSGGQYTCLLEPADAKLFKVDK